MSKEVKRYAERDACELDEAGNYYCRHVSAMTGEGLHSKSEIAAELGWRDMQIDALLAERDALKKDAERYRYLRNDAWGCDKTKRDDMHVVLIGAGVLRSSLTELAEEALDAAIDAAMQGESAK